MEHLRTYGWRIALIASGIALAAGGRMHPDADAEDSLREELATMTADDHWVPGHSLVVLSTVLLALGLWLARRHDVWPRSVRPALSLAVPVVSLYVLETLFHLGAVVDADALREGGAAPVAFAHVALSVVLYPLTGLAVARLALSLGRAWGGLRWGVAALGVLAGGLHFTSVPFAVLFPDTEATPLFAGAGILLALWAVGTGLVGTGRAGGGTRTTARDAARRELQSVS
jgi:hypothetical protein